MGHKGKKIKSDHKEGIGNMRSDLGKVSVIVPVYNVEKYFDECINSILHQTYRNLEIIIVDYQQLRCFFQFAFAEEKIAQVHIEGFKHTDLHAENNKVADPDHPVSKATRIAAIDIGEAVKDQQQGRN